MDARKHAADQANRAIQLAYQAQSAAQQAGQSAQLAASIAGQAAQAAQSILTATQDGFSVLSPTPGMPQPFATSPQPWQ